MGLDIYLYKYNDFEDTQAREEEYIKYSESLWKAEGQYDSIPEARKEEIRALCKAKADKLGLDEWGSDEANTEKIEIKHFLYPDHLFKIGYFRSSYNSSGINNILRDIGLPSLYGIFDVGDNEYYIQPDWEASLKRVESVIEQFSKYDNFSVNSFNPNMFMDDSELPKSGAEAYRIFMQEYERDQSTKMDFNYSNAKGNFFINEPMEVLAIIPGMTSFNKHGVYVVSKMDDTAKKSYLQALEIVRDTCKWVLEQPDIEKYYLLWSG